MVGRRSGAEVERYRRDGVCFPIDVLTRDEAEACRQRFDVLEAREGGRLSPSVNHKIHLLVPWLYDLVCDARILDAVEGVIGPDILCWGSSFFAKHVGDPSYVSWHQDATYWGLSSHDVVTAWVAFSPSTPENGCMRVVPGTHERQLSHHDTFAEGNLLSRGQEIEVEVEEADALDVSLQPGQMSLHHVLIVHGSNRNLADYPRIGYAIRYIPTHLRQLSPIRDSATLVRGTDRYGHFDHEQPPEGEFHPAAVERHAAVRERQAQILYAGAAKKGMGGENAAAM